MTIASGPGSLADDGISGTDHSFFREKRGLSRIHYGLDETPLGRPITSDRGSPGCLNNRDHFYFSPILALINLLTIVATAEHATVNLAPYDDGIAVIIHCQLIGSTDGA